VFDHQSGGAKKNKVLAGALLVVKHRSTRTSRVVAKTVSLFCESL
jgi:hypothetical protein